MERSYKNLVPCVKCIWWAENGDGSQRICSDLSCSNYATAVAATAAVYDMNTQNYTPAEESSSSSSSSPLSATTIERVKRKYISLERFNSKAKLAKPDKIMKWRELELDGTYYVNKIVERMVTLEGRRRKSRYVELDDITSGLRKNVWVTSVIDEALKEYDIKIPTYIRNLGLKEPEHGRAYYNFVIVQDTDDNNNTKE